MRERLEEREPVTRGAVADAVALLVAVGAGPPDQLGTCEQQFFVEIFPGAGEDTRGSGAPLQTDAAVSASELRTRGARPIGESVLAERGPREHGRRLSSERVVRLEPEQDERITCGAVKRAETAVVVVLPP
jgi:hypothetical protein